MTTLDKLAEAVLALEKEAYFDFYFSQDSPTVIAEAVTEKLLAHLGLEAALTVRGDAPVTVTAEIAGETVLFCYKYEKETRYYWEFVSVKKVLTAVEIEYQNEQKVIQIAPTYDS